MMYECNLKEDAKGDGLRFNNFTESWNITLRNALCNPSLHDT